MARSTHIRGMGAASNKDERMCADRRGVWMSPWLGHARLMISIADVGRRLLRPASFVLPEEKHDPLPITLMVIQTGKVAAPVVVTVEEPILQADIRPIFYMAVRGGIAGTDLL